MTYETDPVRWTAHPESAPESLREPLQAAGREGPSSAQMQALSLKLAAVAAGGAAAAATGTAHASAKGAGTLASLSTASSTKLVLAVTLGAVALGGTVWMATRAPAPDLKAPQGVVQTAPHAANLADAPSQPGLAASAREDANPGLHSRPALGAKSATEAHEPTPFAMPSSPSTREAPLPAAQPLAPERRADVQDDVDVRAEATSPRAAVAPARETRRAQRALRARQKISAPRAEANEPDTATSRHAAPNVVGKTAPPSEVELLRRARAALAMSPEDAFTLTEAHREYYPRGVFAQERDALAIEALMRSGEMPRARSLAEKFVSEHPNSPHAHRFREAMGLH